MNKGRPFCRRAVTEKRSCRWQCEDCAIRNEFHDVIAAALLVIAMFIAGTLFMLDRGFL